MTTFDFIGPVSSNTLRPEDLIPTFADILRELAPAHPLVTEADALEDYESEEADYILEDLFDALQECAPPYVSFGSQEGDGACFGFWPEIEALEDAVRYGECLKVADLADIPEKYTGEVMLVNDHGNVTFGTVTPDGFEAIWDCV